MSNPVVWLEVLGQDADKLWSFYGSTFNWSFNPMEGMDYGLVDKAEGGIPGGVGQAPGGPGWNTFYVAVDDVEQSLGRAQELGAQVLMPPNQLPDGGRVAVVSDPEGRPLGLVQMPQA